MQELIKEQALSDPSPYVKVEMMKERNPNTGKLYFYVNAYEKEGPGNPIINGNYPKTTRRFEAFNEDIPEEAENEYQKFIKAKSIAQAVG